MSSKKVMVTALATAALVWPAAASARPVDQAPPPPSSIAVSAADEYAQLRAAGAAQDLRAPDTRDQANGYAPTLQDAGGDDVSVGGFDAVSIALGLAAGIGLAVAAVALAGGARMPRRHVARS